MKKQFLAAFVSALLIGSTGAYAQGTSNALPSPTVEPDDIIMQNGVDLRQVVQVAEASGMARARVESTNFGEVVIFDTGAGGQFFATTFACDGGICRGLHFVALIQSQGTDPTTVDFNSFNGPRPQGNAGYAPDTGEIGIQRLITTFNGVTAGGLAGEIGTFMGYASAFVEWYASQNRVVAASVMEDFEPLVPSKIDNQSTESESLEGTADLGLLIVSLKDAELLTDEAYFRGE
ncbi:MAG: YbjN domain-containing protein [Aquisalinus sp.]|nr:YbjN domain-containing protein [Aquisalinus sp.]